MADQTGEGDAEPQQSRSGSKKRRISGGAVTLAARSGRADLGAHASRSWRRESVNNSQRQASADASLYSWETLKGFAVSGAIAGLIADAVMHPFDTISTRLKAQQESGAKAKYRGLIGTTQTMIKEEGVFSVYKGITAQLYGSLPANALYFGTYEFTKHHGLLLLDDLPISERNHFHRDGVHLMAGITAELATSVVVVPFEVVKSRIQMNQTGYKEPLTGLFRIIRQNGFFGMYAGYKACLTLDCVYSGLQFVIYERIRRAFKHEEIFSLDRLQISAGHRPPGPFLKEEKEIFSKPALQDSMEETAEDLLAGAFSGALAAFLSNPLDVICVRLMIQDEIVNPKVRRYSGVIDCLISVARYEGAAGLWSGSVARMWSIFPHSAIQFAIYEKLKSILTSTND